MSIRYWKLLGLAPGATFKQVHQRIAELMSEIPEADRRYPQLNNSVDTLLRLKAYVGLIEDAAVTVVQKNRFASPSYT